MSAPPTDAAAERVVLLDEEGRAVGTEDKRRVHHRSTPLHLAFSCYVFDEEGRLLVTRRALHKATFPGVWTNSCCGHPAPGEALTGAVHRRVREELGLELAGLRLLLPRFRYRAVMADGVAENEMCPVFTASASGRAGPDPAEVADAVWEPWSDFRAAVLGGSREVSVWCREQVAALPPDPATAPTQPWHDLPPAARTPSP